MTDADPVRTLSGMLARARLHPASPEPGARLAVALSGGRDSVALLHLLRFHGDRDPGTELLALHLDHALRPGSAADAAWIAGLCRAWRVPLVSERLEKAPAGEAEARAARYAFLERARVRRGAAAVLTAHHAGDQAETVLFRAARGTGVPGLRGIRPHRPPAVWRPFLEVDPELLVAYADAVDLRWREDPSNQDRSLTRNALRHEVLPRLEAAVPGARRHLAGLADRARDAEEAWEAVLPRLLEEVGRSVRGRGLAVSRGKLLAMPDALRARLLRALADELGVTLSSTQTRRAVTFSREGRSGTALVLEAGLEVARELDRLVLRPITHARSGPDRPLVIPSDGPGAGEALLAGVRWRVRWGGRRPSGDGGERVRLDAGSLRFPLTVRARAAGDALARPYGHKPLKKLLLEARIPSDHRERVPLLVDGDDRVLWVAGVARAHGLEPTDPTTTFHIHCAHADTD